MDKITINYKKEFNIYNEKEYNQTIIVSNEIKEKYNEYIKELKEIHKEWADLDGTILHHYVKFLRDGKNYLTFFDLDYFKKFYLKKIYTPPKKDKNFERILNRNTIIFVK